MSSPLQRSSKTGRQSLFYRDLASPISAHFGGGGGRFATPGQAAAVSSLWRENFATAADPPPPPVFTLDDRADFSPEARLGDLLPASPSSPTPACGSFSSPSPHKSRVEESGSGAVAHVDKQQQLQHNPGSSNWWSPVVRSSGGGGKDRDEKVNGSPVDGMLQTRALITLPPTMEVARPGSHFNRLPTGVLDEEEWVTVYGFSVGDTNLVLREFEKCGVITKHIPGPRDSNWMHILYKNRYGAQKALRKDGMQINSVLIIGVKIVDPMQRQSLNERINGDGFGGFKVSLPPKSSTVKGSPALGPVGASPRPNHLLTGTSTTGDGGRRSMGAIASPSKSVVSKVMDLLYGI